MGAGALIYLKYIEYSKFITGSAPVGRLQQPRHKVPSFAQDTNKMIAKKSIETVSGSIGRLTIGSETINVVFKQFQHKYIFLDPLLSANDVYDDLSEKALAGDAIAARTLANELEKCGASFSTNEEYLSQLKLLKDENIYSTPNRKFDNFKIAPEGMKSFLAQIKTDYDYCEGLSKEKRSESNKWLSMAAENRDFLAMDRLSTMPSLNPELRHGTLENAWQEFGNKSSAIGLGMYYMGTQYSGDNNLLKPNPIKAYAYLLVGSQLELSSLSIVDPYNSSNREAEIQQKLSVLSADLNLSAQQQEDAEILAMELLETNPNCCYTGQPIVAK